MLTWIAILFSGLVLGWIAAVVADVDRARDVLMWIGAGVGGAILGGALLTPWLGGGQIVVSGFSLPNLLLSLLGAFLVPAVALAQRHRATPSAARSSSTRT